MSCRIVAVNGIDTGIGKSMATGLLAAWLKEQGFRVHTQKPVQTGCQGRPDDILLHRRLMGEPWGPEDEQGLSCSYCLPFAGSPHLAAELAGVNIDPDEIGQATTRLASDADFLLIEGAGGLLVPLTRKLLWLDYLREQGYPQILVTSPRLGSINHTLLSLEAIRLREMELIALVYNLHGEYPREIVRDSMGVFRTMLQRYGFSCPLVLMPDIAESRSPGWRAVLERLSQRA